MKSEHCQQDVICMMMSKYSLEKRSFTCPCAFAKIKSPTTNKEPKATISSPSHVLNSSCNWPVMWLPVWLQHQWIWVRISMIEYSQVELNSIRQWERQKAVTCWLYRSSWSRHQKGKWYSNNRHKSTLILHLVFCSLSLYFKQKWTTTN